jgi:7-keto-8-aminopelargonate synthetase-like enzyme
MPARIVGRRGRVVEKTLRFLSEPLQQIDRTFVLQRGRRLSYFAGCDYFRMASHPAVLAALCEGVGKFGLNVSASRRTTGNHAIYEELESALAKFFGVDAAVLLSTGYSTNHVVAQTLAGGFTHVLADERAHLSLLDAARMLGLKPEFFRHRDPQAAATAARRFGKSAKILLLTDGLFSHTGQVAPLGDYLRLLPRNTTLLVDDAHGAGTIGQTGRGTAQFLGVPTRRIIQTITLSKAFGVYGGAVIGSRKLCRQIAANSRIFTGNTPLPLPLANAALTSLKILRADPSLRRRLALNTSRVKGALAEAGLIVPHGPGPIVPIIPRHARERAALQHRLLAADIHPPFIRYPGGHAEGYFRFVISSEHTAAQLDALIAALTDHC